MKQEGKSIEELEARTLWDPQAQREYVVYVAKGTPPLPNQKFELKARRIYVASSWKNRFFDSVVEELRIAGHEVFDFKSPEVQGPRGGEEPPEVPTAFRWNDVDTGAQVGLLTRERFRTLMQHPRAEAGYVSDRAGMDWADSVVLVLPCGKSAHLEAGFQAGRGKTMIVLFPDNACYHCHGNGKGIDGSAGCHNCEGKGRTYDIEPELMYKLGGSDNICLTIGEVLQKLRPKPFVPSFRPRADLMP